MLTTYIKSILSGLLCIFFLRASATTWNVQVSDFQFSPATLNVKVGDVIHWEWESGFHTTTSLTIPTGAAAWVENIFPTSQTYDYTVTTTGTYNYQCDFHLQMQASFTATAVLPVTMSVFSVQANEEEVTLAWTTETEINTDYFSIRKSLDGVEFKEIGQVPAAGNSSVTRRYSYNDVLSPEKYVYYSIAIVDKDGKYQLSPIEVFKNLQAPPKILLGISPNPVGAMGHVKLKFNAEKKGKLNIRVSDMNGKQVQEVNMAAFPGINTGHMHFGNLPAGTYLLLLRIDNNYETVTLVKN